MPITQDIFQLFTYLDKPRRSAFEKYLQSPYFKSDLSLNERLLSWLDQLSRKDDMEFINSQMEKLSGKELKRLRQICLDFLSQYEYDQLATMKVNLNLAGIRKKNIDKLYKDTLTVVEKLPVYELDQSAEYFYYRSLIEKNIFALKTENEKKNAKVKIASELNIHKISENVDVFFILEVMKNVVHDYVISPVVIESIQQNQIITFCLKTAPFYEEKYPPVKIYFRLVTMLLEHKTQDDQWMDWFDLLKKNQHKIPKKELNLLVQAVEIKSGKKI